MNHVEESGDGVERFKADLVKLTKLQVYVGIPEANSGRKGDIVNNAQLMYIHTNGSPLAHIPARPVIEPAIEAKGNKEPIAEELGEAAKALLDQDPNRTMLHLKRAGMTGQNVVRAWFEDPRNNWAPNAPSTILKKGSDMPLIDTGQLRKAVTYVVKDDNGRYDSDNRPVK